MILIELKPLDNGTHVCEATDDDQVLGQLFMTVGTTHGHLDQAALPMEYMEVLDGLVKTAVHQLFWKGLATGSYNMNDPILTTYFEKFSFPRQGKDGEQHFVLTDFIEAARCTHG